MPDVVVITCAITGGMTVPSQSSAIPITVEQIVEEGVRAAEAGAAILHIHVRDEGTGMPVADVELFEKVIRGLETQTDAVLQLTTGGGRGMSVKDRGAVLELRPEMATLNAGSFNFGLFPVARRPIDFEPWEQEYLEGSEDYVFKNTFADVKYLAGLMRRVGTTPEVEVYDVGQLYNLRQLLKDDVLTIPLNLQFVLGVLGATAAEPDQLLHMLRTAERLFGRENFVWSAAGVGYRGEFDMAAMALMLGGNVRVGLEDNLRLAPGRYATSNAELVHKVAELVRYFDRVPASPAEARSLLFADGAVESRPPTWSRGV